MATQVIPEEATPGGGGGGGTLYTAETRAQLEAITPVAGDSAIPTDGVTNPNGAITERWLCVTAGTWERIDTISGNSFVGTQYDTSAYANDDDYHNGYGSDHATHILIRGGGTYVSGGQALAWHNGAKWIAWQINAVNEFQYYWEDSGDRDNRPLFTANTNFDTLGPNDWTLLSIFHYSNSVWMCQDGVMMVPTGTYVSGQNGNTSSVVGGDHLEQSITPAYPGVVDTDIFQTYWGGPFADGLLWSTNDVPATPSTATIEAAATRALNSYLVQSRMAT